jgi:hypothetical protein
MNADKEEIPAGYLRLSLLSSAFICVPKFLKRF